MSKVMRMLPIFIIFLFFCGAIIFSLVAWTTMTNRELDSPFLLVKPHVFFSSGGTQDSNDENSDPALDRLSTVNEKELIGPDEAKQIEQLKMRVISELRRHVIKGSKVRFHINDYGVNFTGVGRRLHAKKKEILCRIKNTKFKLLSQKSSAELFSNYETKLFPKRPLFDNDEPEEVGAKPIYKTCAMIPNSAAFTGARHGIDIDSHDFVMRFNNAPTDGYEEDVGSFTSMRVVNSQVVTKPRFGFPHSSWTYKGITLDPLPSHQPSNNHPEGKPTRLADMITAQYEEGNYSYASSKTDDLWNSTLKYLIWDPCNYSSTIEEWYRRPDFPLFSKYFKLMEADEDYRNRLYILDCRVIWKLWEILQQHSFRRIYGNPPTSGFIGLMISLQKCERVNVYEYIPSIRESKRCHYYSPKDNVNPTCTYGSWHPVSAEKLFFLDLSDSSDKDIFMEGVLSIPGTSHYDCD